MTAEQKWYSVEIPVKATISISLKAASKEEAEKLVFEDMEDFPMDTLNDWEMKDPDWADDIGAYVSLDINNCMVAKNKCKVKLHRTQD